MQPALLISAVGLGILSSFHCIGMCGAIALSLPVQHMPASKKIAAVFLYHTGRIMMYALLGLLFGIAGRQLYMAGLQKWFSIIIGMAMLLFAIQRLFGNSLPALQFKPLNKIFTAVQKIISRLMKSRSNIGSLFLLGLANGILPCGMVYFAIAAALAAGSLSGAVSFMVFFGIGTVPAMLMLSYLGYRFKLSFRQGILKAMPFIIALMGMLFVLRGMGLNIPCISPELPSRAADAVICH